MRILFYIFTLLTLSFSLVAKPVCKEGILVEYDSSNGEHIKSCMLKKNGKYIKQGSTHYYSHKGGKLLRKVTFKDDKVFIPNDKPEVRKIPKVRFLSYNNSVCRQTSSKELSCLHNINGGRLYVDKKPIRVQHTFTGDVTLFLETETTPCAVINNSWVECIHDNRDRHPDEIKLGGYKLQARLHKPYLNVPLTALLKSFEGGKVFKKGIVGKSLSCLLSTLGKVNCIPYGFVTARKSGNEFSSQVFPITLDSGLIEDFFSGYKNGQTPPICLKDKYQKIYCKGLPPFFKEIQPIKFTQKDLLPYRPNMEHFVFENDTWCLIKNEGDLYCMRDHWDRRKSSAENFQTLKVPLGKPVKELFFSSGSMNQLICAVLEDETLKCWEHKKFIKSQKFSLVDLSFPKGFDTLSLGHTLLCAFYGGKKMYCRNRFVRKDISLWKGNIEL